MKARGRVRGILIEGDDGREYLLGFRPEGTRATPTLSRREGDGTFHPLEDGREASRLAVAQLGISGPRLIGPGMGQDFFLWLAFGEALKTFPAIPAWPTWSP